MSSAGHFRAVTYIEHMIEAIGTALAYVENCGETEFIADKRTQQAVIMNILIAGEAATKLATRHPDYIRKHPEIPWRSIRGMRNRLIHGYFEINLETVWNTLQHDFPALHEQLSRIKAKS